MRAVVSLVGVLLSVSTARASGPRPPTVLATATATSAQPKSPAWGAIDNVSDRRAWCPATGKGVGESLTITFDRPIPATGLSLYFGTVKSVLVTAGSQHVTVDGKMNVPLDGSAISSLTIQITGVDPKQKPCFTGVRVTSPSTWIYQFLYGVDAAAVRALPDVTSRLDLALRHCDLSSVAGAIKFPLTHVRELQLDDMDPTPRTPEKHTYKSPAELEKACRSSSSTLAAGYADRTFDADLATDVPLATSTTAGEARIGPWTLVWTPAGWQLTAINTMVTQSRPDAIGDQWMALAEPARVAEAYTPDATFALLTGPSALVRGGDLGKRLEEVDKTPSRGEDNELFAMSRDGQAAWYTADWPSREATAYRISQVLVHTSAGWRIAGGMISVAQPNKAVNDAAKANKPFTAMPPLPADDGDASLRDAFKALLAGPLDKEAAARKDLVAIGSGPGERSVGGAALARPWAAAWAKHTSLVGGITAKLAPSGSTGWVVADVILDKKTSKVPFRLLVVFDKTAAGAWSVVHVHFAVPAP